MKRFSGVLCALFACVLVIDASSAFAGTTRAVGTCTKATYSTIQAAVNASASGDKIKVCAGTYTEQVSIPAGKSNLTLQSDGHFAATIRAPASMSSPKAIVRVNGATNTTIKDFVIEGPGGGPCDSLESGIRIDSGGSATVTGNHIAHIRDQPLGGCQNGVGIQSGRSADSTSGSVILKGNTIDDFQKNGVTVSGTGSNGTITGNTITGAGPTAVIAQNGIQVSTGASAAVKQNTVSGAVYSPATTSSTGILLFGPPGTVSVSNNTLNSNDVGVYAYGASATTSITKNTSTASTFDGITLDSSTSPLLTGNITNSGDRGIGVYATTGAQIKNNHASNNAGNGFYAASDTSGNTFQGNMASGGGSPACLDQSTGGGTAGTANTWKKNTGATSSPLGICLP